MWSQCRNLRIPLQCLHGSWGTSGVSPGESVLVPSGGMHVRFPPELQQQCHASLRMSQGICAFPSRLSQRAVPRATWVCVNFDPRLESRGGAGKTGFPGIDLDIWGTLGMVARPWSSSLLSYGERLLLRCHGNVRYSFPTTQGKDPSSRYRRRKRGSSGCGRDSCSSSRVETGLSGNFLSCRKGVKDPLEVPEVRCD